MGSGDPRRGKGRQQIDEGHSPADGDDQKPAVTFHYNQNPSF